MRGANLHRTPIIYLVLIEVEALQGNKWTVVELKSLVTCVTLLQQQESHKAMVHTLNSGVTVEAWKVDEALAEPEGCR